MSAGLMAVARPLVSLIYGGGEFDAFSTQITASALSWMALGMAGYALQNILSRAYFARQQGRVPLIAGGGRPSWGTSPCPPPWQSASL